MGEREQIYLTPAESVFKAISRHTNDNRPFSYQLPNDLCLRPITQTDGHIYIKIYFRGVKYCGHFYIKKHDVLRLERIVHALENITELQLNLDEGHSRLTDGIYDVIDEASMIGRYVYDG